MRIAFPVMDDKGLEALLADHFGRAPLYTVVDTETKEVSVLQNTGEHFGGQHSAPVSLNQSNINVLICKGLGRKAIDLFNQLKISVYLTQDIFVKEALDSYNKNILSLATDKDSCTESHHH